MTYFILANPNSGAHKGARVLEKLLPYLETERVDYRLFATEKIGQEAELIKKICEQKEEIDHLIIIGGDGTLSLSIDALPAEMPFSYIPAGSGNDFARSLSLSTDPIQAFVALQKGNSHDIFIIKYQSQHLNGYALNNIGIGLDAAIVKATNEGGMKKFLNRLKLGSLSYLLTALHVLFTKKSFRADVNFFDSSVKNNDLFDRAFLMTFTKHPYFGGGIRIAPDASNLDANIHLVEFDRIPLAKIFPLIPKVLNATHLDNPNFIHHISENFSITTSDNQPIQIDGETHEIRATETLNLSTEKRTIIY
ncbi:diacylglycerol/lipid kinase family protein [Lactococcus nasutitermitis]|uniref:Diacylglycerol/lipid kinase family protein n=1 Tax=Lactococcus nasutitermitis TaxID=1652957 RepID=A0ABV9JF09_9LACT|nr:diacylglycerol kinase family protein [Lactococcus nasutitermitis]